MGNLLDDLVYITLADARDTSTILSNASSPTDNKLTSLITQAQYIIDTYITSYGEKDVVSQSFIFPTIEDWIPADIQLATVRITEQLFLQGENLWVLKGEKAISESNMSRSVNYSDKESYMSSVETINIPKKALNILDKYRNNFIWQVV